MDDLRGINIGHLGIIVILEGRFGQELERLMKMKNQMERIYWEASPFIPIKKMRLNFGEVMVNLICLVLDIHIPR